MPRALQGVLFKTLFRLASCLLINLPTPVDGVRSLVLACPGVCGCLRATTNGYPVDQIYSVGGAVPAAANTVPYRLSLSVQAQTAITHKL